MRSGKMQNYSNIRAAHQEITKQTNALKKGSVQYNEVWLTGSSRITSGDPQPIPTKITCEHKNKSNLEHGNI